MKRLSIKPRENFKEIVASQGLTINIDDYYTETAAYQFSEQEILNIEKATNKLQEMSLEVVQHIINNNLWDEMFIPKEYAELIKHSWDSKTISFIGRMDLAYNNGQIKFIEYNGDTPASMVESATIQKKWLEDYAQLNANINYNQFNSITDSLVEHMKSCQSNLIGDKVLTFTTLQDCEEEMMNVMYLHDVAKLAGINTEFLYLNEIGLSRAEKFVREDSSQLRNVYKYYPYEYLFGDEYGQYLTQNKEECQFLEPAWKAIVSNKMFSKFLYDLFPKSEYVLPCSYGKPISDNYVKKPLISCGGANIEVVIDGECVAKTDGNYGDGEFIYQDYFRLPDMNGNFPIIGSWLVGDKAAGISIRENTMMITNNTSKFCPHFFTK